MKDKFAVCINNDDYPASLEKRKIYTIVPDSKAEKNGFLKIIDESGDDYLYPMKCFHSITLSKELEQQILKAS